MKDNKQNLTDLIGALAVDIEYVKKKLDAKDSSGKNEALKGWKRSWSLLYSSSMAIHRKMSMPFSEARNPLRNTSNQ